MQCIFWFISSLTIAPWDAYEVERGKSHHQVPTLQYTVCRTRRKASCSELTDAWEQDPSLVPEPSCGSLEACVLSHSPRNSRKSTRRPIGQQTLPCISAGAGIMPGPGFPFLDEILAVTDLGRPVSHAALPNSLFEIFRFYIYYLELIILPSYACRKLEMPTDGRVGQCLSKIWPIWLRMTGKPSGTRARQAPVLPTAHCCWLPGTQQHAAKCSPSAAGSQALRGN